MPKFDAITYYAERAPYYDALYAKPERQADLLALGGLLKNIVSGRNVLEIACGTGYWTQAMAETARSVCATDINETMLHIARQKTYPQQNVTFEARDMYALAPGRDFNALFGGFIWSHIPVEQLADWLDHLHRLLAPGSLVVFADNRFVSGSNIPIAATDHRGNTFQTRKLENGEEYLIVKNFPKIADFERILKDRGQQIHVTNLDYYWLLQYRIA